LSRTMDTALRVPRNLGAPWSVSAVATMWSCQRIVLLVYARRSSAGRARASRPGRARRWRSPARPQKGQVRSRPGRRPATQSDRCSLSTGVGERHKRPTSASCGGSATVA
jgi:hypothetical protein